MSPPEATTPQPITRVTAPRLGHVTQLGGHDSYSYPKFLCWHPTQPVLALEYPLNDPRPTESRIAFWTTAGILAAMLTAPSPSGHSVSWSADGGLLAVGQTTIKVYRSPMDAPLRRLPGTRAEWSPSQPLLMTQDGQGLMRWDLQQGTHGRLMDSQHVPLGWRSTLYWTSRGTVRGVDQQAIRQWDTNGTVLEQTPWVPHWTLPRTTTMAIVPTWNPAGDQLAVWTNAEVAVVDAVGVARWTVPSNTQSAFFRPVAWHPTGTALATIDGRHVQVWTADGRHISTATDPYGGIACLAWSPDGELLATGSWGSTISVWTRTGDLVRMVPTYRVGRGIGAVFLVTWSPDGRYLAASLRDCTVHLYAVVPGEEPPPERPW